MHIANATCPWRVTRRESAGNNGIVMHDGMPALWGCGRDGERMGAEGERENPRVAARECIVIGLQMANTCNGQMIEVQCVVSISM